MSEENDKVSHYAFLFFMGALVLSMLVLVGMLFGL